MDRAREYIHAHLAEPISLADLSLVAGISARCLQRSFKRSVGTPPLRYLRERRLAAANRELLAADPGETSVTDVAYRHGFFHLSRFAARYDNAFGELPSATLQRELS